jgi:hypothetical protein
MKKLFKLAIFIGLIVALAKFISEQKAAWTGLTEPEIRDKLQTKLDSKMKDEQIGELADKVIEEMRKRGMVGEEAAADEAPAEDEPAATE